MSARYTGKYTKFFGFNWATLVLFGREQREEPVFKQKNTAYLAVFGVLMAERGGFEPPIGYSPIHAFQACDLNRSSISPERYSQRVRL